MKKVIRCLCMIALVALTVTSCKKNETKTTFTARTQKLVYEGETNRAFIGDDEYVHFETGDVCMVYNINNTNPSRSHCATYEALETGSVVTFQNCGLGEIAGEKMDAFYAYYPGGYGKMWTELGQGENKTKFTIDPEQDYRKDATSGQLLTPLHDFPMFAKVDNVAQLGDADFDFMNIFGVLQLQLFDPNGPTVVKKIEITDNTFALTGQVEVNIPAFGNNYDEFISAVDNYNSNPNQWNAWKNSVGLNMTNQGNTITLNLPEEGVQIGTTQATSTSFEIVLRPLALSQGCSIKLTFADGSYKTIDLVHNYMIKPNFVRPLGFNLANY